MGGFFGVVSKRSAISDVFFGTDYHSHLGTKSAGVASYEVGRGLQRQIHSLENTSFRAKFEHIFSDMHGSAAIGGINDTDPQPLLIRSRLGTYAICTIGVIHNAEAIVDNYLDYSGGHYDAMTGGDINTTELVASLINQKGTFEEGIQFAQEKIEGTASILILKDNGHIVAARDKVGRLPVILGKNDNGYAVTFESFAFTKLGYELERELGPGEIVEISADEIVQLKAPGDKLRICSFLWTYYGYPTSNYEGVNVEMMRYKNGHIMAKHDMETMDISDIDYVGGVPDSGTPHAIGYSNESKRSFARAFIKYTPTWSRSFMPPNQEERDKVAKMKQVPVKELIEGKNLLFVDDSIVRGTQLRETVEFLYESGAKSVHMRSACPPIMYGCKFLNFSRATSDMELIARRIIVELEGQEGLQYMEEYSDFSTERGQKLREKICAELHLASLEFQSLQGVIDAIGIGAENLCTYCWNGKE